MPVIKQHYVPRELLRNFSCDAEQKRINMFYLTENKEIENVDLYNQACEKYYYGEDQRLENAYSILEGNFASALKKLINGDTDLTNEEDAAVRVFMVFQLNRTPEAVKRTNSFMSETMKEILRSNTTLEKSIKEHIDDFYVTLTQPHDYLFGISLDIAYTVSDLKISLLENPDETFIIGKSPVFVLNPFLYELKYDGGLMGIGSKGAVILMPISPRYTVILYDSIVYNCKKTNGKIIPSNTDIQKFNYCQFLKTTDCVYYFKADVSELKKMNSDSYKYRNTDDAFSKKINVSKDEKKYFIWTSYKQFPIIQQLDFIRLRESAYRNKLGPFNSIERPTLAALRLQNEKMNNKQEDSNE